MADLAYHPLREERASFPESVGARRAPTPLDDDPAVEYAVASQLLAARNRAGLTQDAVAQLMGTTKSAISRLETAGKHAPSLTTLRRYAEAVGCRLEVRLVPLK